MGLLNCSGMYVSIGISVDLRRKCYLYIAALNILSGCLCRTFVHHYLAVKEVEYWLIRSGLISPAASSKVFVDSLIRVVCDFLIV
jgi:hypothetical protein